MSEIEQPVKNPETLSAAAIRYADAVGDAHHEAEKQYRAVWRNYLETLKNALAQPNLQEAAREYAEGVQKSLGSQDSQQYLEAVRHYAAAVQEAQQELQARLKEAYEKWKADVQQVSEQVAGTYRAEFGNYVKALQTAFSEADASKVDATTLAEMGSATLTAAVLRTRVA